MIESLGRIFHIPGQKISWYCKEFVTLSVSPICLAKKALFWVKVAPGHFSENNFHPLNVGFKISFCQCPEMGPEVSEPWFSGLQTWVSMGQNSLFGHFQTHVAKITKAHLNHSWEVGIVLRKVPWGSPDPTSLMILSFCFFNLLLLYWFLMFFCSIQFGKRYSLLVRPHDSTLWRSSIRAQSCILAPENECHEAPHRFSYQVPHQTLWGVSAERRLTCSLRLRLLQESGKRMEHKLWTRKRLEKEVDPGTAVN